MASTSPRELTRARKDISTDAHSSWAKHEGSPFPLGVNFVAEENAYNFALFSEHAESVELLLFREDDTAVPCASVKLDAEHHRTNRVWHCRLADAEIGEATLYGYRIAGPGPDNLHQFRPDKVLFDPYAKGLYFPDSFDRDSAIKSGASIGKVPLGVIRSSQKSFDWGEDRRPRHDSDLVIYEVHVKGFTRADNSQVREDRRGTYLGMIDKIPHLKELGITAVELLPVFQFDPQEKNYWGYMPISFFSPHVQYANARSVDEQLDEFRSLVKALHEADIEVILDVVYNHTGEGNLDGPTYNLRGIDNSVYYLPSGNPDDPYFNFSGTGNAINASHPFVRRLIVDSLRYWVEEMHVDGFRFDLASCLARIPGGGVDPHPAIFDEIANDPVLQDIRFLAEPWDAAGLYQLGGSFGGENWQQWNDAYRDTIRRFVRGDTDQVKALMGRLYGSCDIFPDDRHNTRRPSQSLNYICSHDGFTLYDLVSFNEKHNAANEQGGTDGHNHNFSWNCGVEGHEGVSQEILDLRMRQVRNLATLLFLSNGTPMLMAGDEFLNSQNGNNNPYNQDNDTAWIDWSALEKHGDVFRFFKKLIEFRKAHPSICRSRYWKDDISWYGTGELVDMNFNSHSLSFCLHGESVGDTDLYVMMNLYPEELEFTVQEGRAKDWCVTIDTSKASPEDILDRDQIRPLESLSYPVAGRSVVVLEKLK